MWQILIWNSFYLNFCSNVRTNVLTQNLFCYLISYYISKISATSDYFNPQSSIILWIFSIILGVHFHETSRARLIIIARATFIKFRNISFDNRVVYTVTHFPFPFYFEEDVTWRYFLTACFLKIFHFC